MSYSSRMAELESQPLREIASSVNGRPKNVWWTVRQINRRRELLRLLVRRDLTSRYKDSVLGFVWTLARPLTQLLIFYLVIGKFLGAERGIPNFAVYMFAGLTAYTLFSELVTSGTSSVVANRGLVKKVFLPREIFPLASVGASLFNFLIQFLILLAACLITGTLRFDISLLLFFPALFTILIYGFAVSLFLSAMNVVLRDIQYLVEVALMVFMWASPILYSWEMAKNAISSPIIVEIYTNSPLTLAVLGFQKSLWDGGRSMLAFPTNLELRLLGALLLGLLLTYFAQRFFTRRQGSFAQFL